MPRRPALSTQTSATIEGLTATAQAYYEWTDSLTPEPNDGRAFFAATRWRTTLIGAMQLGTELFTIQDGKWSCISIKT